MTGALAHKEAARIRAAIERALEESPESRSASTRLVREALLNVLDVLESSVGAVVLPVDDLVSTQQAAEILGVSRMTVVRLIDRGEIDCGGGGVHRRISAKELERYRAKRSARRRSAVATLAGEIDGDTPPDRVITTR